MLSFFRCTQQRSTLLITPLFERVIDAQFQVKSDLDDGAGRANPWSLGIFWPLFSWAVKSIVFNPSLVHTRSSQSHPDIPCAPAGTLQRQVLSGSIGVGGWQSTREADKCVFPLHIWSLSLAIKAQFCSCLLLSCKLNHFYRLTIMEKGRESDGEWSGWWRLDSLGSPLCAAGCGCQVGCS